MTNTLTALYRDTRIGNKTLYLDGKKCATPPMAGTQPPFIAGPLGVTGYMRAFWPFQD
jgi:hypothetical protein